MAQVTQIYGSHDEQWQNQISSYIDGELNGHELAQFEQHLKTCSICQANLAALEKTVKAVRAVPQVWASRSFALTQEQAEALRPSKGYKWATLAASIAAILIIALFAMELAGSFNVTTVETRVQATPTPSNRIFSTPEPCVTTTPGQGSVGCAGGVTSSTNGQYIEVPVIKETYTRTTSETAVVRIVQLLLAIAFGGLLVLAYALRPRAPTKRKLRM
jgi:Putative zinc-finger